MLQTLLGDRFKLKMYRIPKHDSVYMLVITKGGPKFKTVPDNGTGQHIVETGKERSLRGAKENRTDAAKSTITAANNATGIVTTVLRNEGP